MEHLFRCYDFENKMFLFTDLNIKAPEFPDYIKMIQIGGWESYEITQSCLITCSATQELLYEKDIVRYKNGMYRIAFNAPGFVLECLDGEFIEWIDTDEVVKIGTEYDEDPDIQVLINQNLPENERLALYSSVPFTITQDTGIEPVSQ